MSQTDLMRLVFVTLCAMGAVAITLGAVFEHGRHKRGVSILTPRHRRWRLISVALWLLILASFAFATLFLWPQNAADTLTARRFIAVSLGATCLLVIALGLMALDFVWTARARIGRQGEFQRNLDALAREEIERAQKRASGEQI